MCSFSMCVCDAQWWLCNPRLVAYLSCMSVEVGRVACRVQKIAVAGGEVDFIAAKVVTVAICKGKTGYRYSVVGCR